MKHSLKLTAGTTTGFILLTLLIAFPKGGVKLGSLPITFSYIFLGIASAVAFLRVPSRPTKTIFSVFLCTLPLAALCGVKLIFFPPGNVAWTVSLLSNVIVIPALCLLILPKLLHSTLLVHGRRFRTIIFLVCSFGVADFISRNFAKVPLEVPYLTVNVDDVGKQDLKENDRGPFIKLISTYGNGNIFGVCMCLIGPIFLLLRPNKLQTLVLLVSTFLTLSRTAWFGLMVWAFAWQLIFRKRSAAIFYSPTFAILGLGIFYLGMRLIGRDASFIFDASLGGRIVESNSWTPVVFSMDAFTSIGEMTYNSFTQQLGLLALPAFCLWLWSPIITLIRNWKVIQGCSLARVCLVSLVTYSIVCSIDGAFLLIPVMAIYWCIAGIGLYALEEEKKRAQWMKVSFSMNRQVALPQTDRLVRT